MTVTNTLEGTMLNRTRFFLFFFMTFCALHTLGQVTPEYEVYIIEFGYILDFQVSLLDPKADATYRADMSYLVWLIKGAEGRNILVDAGFRPDMKESLPDGFQPDWYLSPDKALAKLYIASDEITDIILTHIHWDHSDGLPLFPNAHIWIQKEEMEYYTTVAWQKGGNNVGVVSRNILELVRLNTERRVTLVDGDNKEIIPGIRVYTGPRHSFASQYVGVNTSGGTVIIASDCAWTYANLEQGFANSITFDPEADVKAFNRMKQLASKSDWILPGHDRIVFEKFPNPIEGVAQIR